MIKKTVLLLLMIASAGCATRVARYAASEADAPHSVYVEGVPFTASEGENSLVIIGPAAAGQSASDRQIFYVEVQNKSDRPFVVGPDNFSFVIAKGVQVAVVTPERLQREANRKANWLRFASTMAQMNNSSVASDAGYSSGSAVYRGETSSTYRTSFSGRYGDDSFYGSADTRGSSTTYGVASYSSYDGAAAAQAHFAAAAANRRIADRTERRINELMNDAQQGSLKQATILPGSSMKTLITIEKIPSANTPLSLTATIANEVHSFSWNYSVE